MSQPYVHLPAAEVRATLGGHTDAEVKLLRESWNDMPVDGYLKGGADYRRRRYSEFRLTDAGLVRAPHGAFHQSLDVNPLHGGVAREFAPVEDAVAHSPVLAALVRGLLERLPGTFDTAGGAVGVHQIRITATRDAAGLPAPEGIHEDGHHFVAQVLIHRENVEGGHSQLYDRDRAPLFSTRLTEPFETIIIDDRRVFHGVSAIEPGADLPYAVRDMMLVDFFPAPVSAPAAHAPAAHGPVAA
ncbi:2OG-Fe dioxygenase family protein [Streptomyces sp. NPDC059708]|uniref:2OG-Fe dioxygenase family protein n=1 Tax=Streptomyces sp. NPDC059708 TaxID=3346916 RepID=UPI0036A0D82D